MLPFLAGACGNLFGGSLSDVLVRRFGLEVRTHGGGATGLFLSALCLFGTAVTPNKYWAVAFLTSATSAWIACSRFPGRSAWMSAENMRAL